MLIFFVVCYLLGTILVGWLAARRVHDTKDFVNAGRRLPVIIVGSALFATWFGSETVLGASSEFVENGLIGVVEDPFGAALCLVLIGLFFARPLYRLNILTFNDYFRLRYNARVEFVSALLLIPSYFGWIAAQLVAMAIILKALLGTSIVAGVLICTVVVVLYTYVGGMWAVSITDFIQTILIIVGLLALALELVGKVGGLQAIYQQTPSGFFHFLPEKSTVGIAEYMAAWITIGLGSIPQQDIFQRVNSARNENVAVWGSYLSGILYLTVAFLPLTIGLCGKILYPELLETQDAQMVIPMLVLTHSNLTMQILFFGAVLSAILSTTSGAILAPAVVLGENLIKPNVQKMSDKQLLQIIRYSILFIAGVSALMACMRSNIYELVGESSAFSLVSLFVPLAAGLYWKRATSLGAMLAMILGLLVWFVTLRMETAIPSILYGLAASVLGMVLGSFWRDET